MMYNIANRISHGYVDDHVELIGHRGETNVASRFSVIARSDFLPLRERTRPYIPELDKGYTMHLPESQSCERQMVGNWHLTETLLVRQPLTVAKELAESYARKNNVIAYQTIGEQTLPLWVPPGWVGREGL